MTQTIIKVPAAGAFDPTDIEITDGVDDAFLIKDTGGNEWFKIDTRTGTGSDCINMAYTSGQKVLIGKPASSGQGPFSPFQVINQNLDSQAVRIYGSASYDTTNQFTWGGPTNQPAMIHPYGLLFRNSASTGTFKFQDSSNADMFVLDDDTNATFTLDSGNSAVFKVQDDAGTPTEYMKIDTTSGAELTKFVVHDDGVNDNNFIVSTDRSNSSLINVTPRNTGLGNAEGVFFNGSSSTQVWVSGPSIFRLQNCSLIHNMTGSQNATTYLGTAADWIVTRGSPSEEMIKFEHDSNMTFTLDDGSGAQFKVVNDAGSPKTFLSIADGGSTFLDSESSTYLRANGASHIVLTGGELQMGASGKFVIHQTGYPLYKRSPNLLDLGATTGTTVVNLQTDGQYKKIKCNPSTASQTFTLEFQDSTSSNRDYVVEQDFAIHNNGTENCTIQATVTSGRGSALGKDLSAGGSTSGELVTGMTLNAGKTALFKAVKWNKELAGTATMADNEFMFQTIMVEA